MLRLPFTPSPSRASSPAAGSTRLSIARARVDLPQPDSPTTPRISPLRQSNETPSTARVTLRLTRNSTARSRTSIRLWVGHSLASRRGGVGRGGLGDLGPLAPGRVVTRGGLPRPHLAQRRVLEAALGRVRTAGPKATALGRLVRVGGAARDRSREAALAPDHRQRLEQALRVRMLGAFEDGAHRPDLDDPARVHDRDPVAGLGEHPEVVRDQDQRQPEPFAQALEQLQHLRLHDHVERGGGLVGDHQRGVAGERQRDHHPLALAPGELVRVAMTESRGEPDGLEQLVGALAHVARARVGACRLIASANWSSTRCTGSSEFIAPWKTSEMWRQRT